MFLFDFSRLTWELSSKSDGRSSSSRSSSGPSSSSGESPRLLHAQWAPAPPSDPEATPVAFVEDYSVFYVSDVGAAPARRRVFPISPPDAVEPEVVMHGVPDWIYEGETL